MTNSVTSRGRRTRALPRIVSAASLALLLPLALSVPASADLPGKAFGGAAPDVQTSDNMDPKIMATMRAQEALQPAAQLLNGEALRDPSSGFKSVAFEGDGLALYWKGGLTTGMKTAVAQARTIGPVTVQPADYSLAELIQAAQKIDAIARSDSDIQTIAFEPHGHGLEISTMPATTVAKVAQRQGHGLVRTADVLAGLDLGVPVTVSQADRPMELMGCPSTGCTRRDDTASWNAGDYMSNRTAGVGCTTGFGVNYGGRSWILTAAHCMSWKAGGGDNNYDGAGEFIGRASLHEDWQHDIILVDAAGYYWMFDGSPTTNFKKTVHSWGNRSIGELLCQSGATSGTVCGLRTDRVVYANHACDSDGDCYDMLDLVQVIQVDGKTAAQKGDSGGPVFSLDGDGVRAKGIVSACEGSIMLFQDMNDITTSRSGASPWPGVSIRTN